MPVPLNPSRKIEDAVNAYKKLLTPKETENEQSSTVPEKPEESQSNSKSERGAPKPSKS